MSPWALLLLTTIFLFVPRLLAQQTRVEGRAQAKPEIDGFLRVMEALNTSYCRFWHRLSTDRWAPLPTVGPAILIANHTCGIDHMLLQAATQRLLGFMIAQEYYEGRWIHWICRAIGCIPVKRDGRDLSATRAGLRALKEGRVLPIFPEGHIVPTSGRRLDELKLGCAYLAIHSQAPVVPAYICGTPETNDIIKSLMTPSRARIIFGEPLDLSDISRDRSGDKAALAEVTERFKLALTTLQVRALADQQSIDY